jgi:Ni/Co efflux regulator RcnB
MSANKWLYLALSAALSLTPTAVAAQGNGHGHDNEKKEKHDRDQYRTVGSDDRVKHSDRDDRGRDRDKDKGEDKGERGRGRDDRHSYREHDRELHGWYEGHRNHLPPGLAKRDELPPGLQRQLVVRGTLPPGLRLQMHPCPVEVVRYLPPPPVGYMHAVVGGNVVLVNRRTYFVLDIYHF